jgi:predicted esterase YcpF (UPF0227 family)
VGCAGVVGQVVGGYVSDRLGVKFTIAAIMLADVPARARPLPVQ